MEIRNLAVDDVFRRVENCFGLNFMSKFWSFTPCQVYEVERENFEKLQKQ